MVMVQLPPAISSRGTIRDMTAIGKGEPQDSTLAQRGVLDCRTRAKLQTVRTRRGVETDAGARRTARGGGNRLRGLAVIPPGRIVSLHQDLRRVDECRAVRAHFVVLPLRKLRGREAIAQAEPVPVIDMKCQR